MTLLDGCGFVIRLAYVWLLVRTLEIPREFLFQIPAWLCCVVVVDWLGSGIWKVNKPIEKISIAKKPKELWPKGFFVNPREIHLIELLIGGSMLATSLVTRPQGWVTQAVALTACTLVATSCLWWWRRWVLQDRIERFSGKDTGSKLLD